MATDALLDASRRLQRRAWSLIEAHSIRHCFISARGQSYATAAPRQPFDTV